MPMSVTPWETWSPSRVSFTYCRKSRLAQRTKSATGFHLVLRTVFHRHLQIPQRNNPASPSGVLTVIQWEPGCQQARKLT